jgi:membrane-bound lytic murein transglycosylase D
LAWCAALLLAGCASVPLPPSAEVPANPPAPPVATAATPPAASAPAPLPELASAPLVRQAQPEPPPRARLDPEADAERGDLWARVRAGYAMPDLEGELVSKWENYYSSRPEYVQRMTERGGRYLFHIVEEIEQRGLPTDLALLPFIESAFNPQAMSRARASGMWQFMPATGRDFELRQNLFRDDRRDVLASTRAALDYLQRLHARFGDWHLALAAYNWGQGNVQRAIDRNRKAGLGTAYTDLRMPDETRNYVPKLQAVKNIVARPADFALVLPPLENHPYFLSVPIERDIDVALAARLAGLTLEEFQQLNPQMNKPVILAAGTPLVLLPYDNANSFLRNLEKHRGPLASWTAWVAQRNISTAEAARLVGMPEARLREVNRIPPRMLVKKGSTLLVPRSATAQADVAEHIADHAAIALAPEARPARRVTVKARKGDTVASVARRHKVSARAVAQWNGVAPQAKFKTGQQVVLMLAPKKPAARTRTAAKKGGAKKPAVARAQPNRQRVARN